MAPKRFEEPVYTPPKPRGRPRKDRKGRPESRLLPPVLGDNAGTATTNGRMDSGTEERAVAPHTSVSPRLVDLSGAAAYLAVSPWTIREWAGNGWLPRVRFLLPNGREVRKLLFDTQDLDRLIERAKDGGS